MALEHRRRPVLRLVGCLGGAVLVAASGLWPFARRWQDEVGTYSFAPDVEVRLFIESDIDNPPSYFYEIRRSGRLVTPPTFLDVVSDRDEPTEARQASSADGSVHDSLRPPEQRELAAAARRRVHQPTRGEGKMARACGPGSPRSPRAPCAGADELSRAA